MASHPPSHHHHPLANPDFGHFRPRPHQRQTHPVPLAESPPHHPAAAPRPSIVACSRRCTLHQSFPFHRVAPPAPPPSPNMARVYADVNSNMPRSYWDYDSVNISTLHHFPLPRRRCSGLVLIRYSRLGCFGELRSRPQDWYAASIPAHCSRKKKIAKINPA